MLQKKLFARIVLSLSLFAAYASAPSLVNAGVTVATATLQATTSTSIEVGGSVTFAVTYECNDAQWAATAELIDGNGNPISSPITLTDPNGNGEADTETVTLTFSQSTTVGVDFTSENQNCRVGNSITPLSGIPVTVTAAATTTTTAAPTTTTTIAPTTTVATTLPSTGTNSSNALVALLVAAIGGIVITARRRLVAK